MCKKSFKIYFPFTFVQGCLIEKTQQTIPEDLIFDIIQYIMQNGLFAVSLTCKNILLKNSTFDQFKKIFENYT